MNEQSQLANDSLFKQVTVGVLVGIIVAALVKQK